jgi:hypothetical protein
MKKYIYGALFLATVGITILACKKEMLSSPNSNRIVSSSTSAQKEKDELNVQNKDKNICSDSILMSTILGNIPDYVDLSALEDLLMDNASLSTTVLTSLMLEHRIPDDLVELMTVLSSPVNPLVLAKIRLIRPKINRETILSVQNVNPTFGFTVHNTNPRSVIFGTNMKVVKNDSCACVNIVCNKKGYKSVTLKTPFSDPSKNFRL